MFLKNVYSIRLNRQDTLIKDYLKKYPVANQSLIIKSLIIDGIHARQNEAHGIKGANEKLEEILVLLKKMQILEKSTKGIQLEEGN
ncbi:hypothetical protein [Niallia endozanthoxylica]|uniref:Uncharacterized protein n=1 Tax=Niallia endozanthoxylica TaxID=2036016 RepID=A0A5J5H2T9_9BACI|nr:hypothetical protein [Niallia endozanthoxylica]KAA9014911.1 hypothetical protein F4V44_23225 [Niallia endozanthoxylica]